MSCLVDDCTRPTHARGLCGMHAQRLRRTGDPVTTRRTPTLVSFWRRVDKAGPGDCWLWTGSVTRAGYGQIATRLRPTASGTRLAHRVSYELLIGPIPSDAHLDHLCRVTTCVNPAHLEPVTVRENVRRGLHGVLRTHCKYGHELTPENTHYDRKRNCRRCRTCQKRWQLDARARRASVREMFGAWGHR